MCKEMQKVFILSDTEYNILLAGKGADKCFTLKTNTSDMDKAKVCKAMNNLYVSSLVNSDGEKFVIDEKLNEIIDTIIKSTKIMYAKTPDGKILCGYMLGDIENVQKSDLVTVCERKEKGQNKVRLYQCEYEEIEVMLMTQQDKTKKCEVKYIDVIAGRELKKKSIFKDKLRGKLI